MVPFRSLIKRYFPYLFWWHSISWWDQVPSKRNEKPKYHKLIDYLLGMHNPRSLAFLFAATRRGEIITTTKSLYQPLPALTSIQAPFLSLSIRQNRYNNSSTRMAKAVTAVDTIDKKGSFKRKESKTFYWWQSIKIVLLYLFSNFMEINNIINIWKKGFKHDIVRI